MNHNFELIVTVIFVKAIAGVNVMVLALSMASKFSLLNGFGPINGFSFIYLFICQT